jgi:epoxide hydrolase-like predicted phosphatase
MTDNETKRGNIRGLVFDSGGVLIRTVNPLPRRDLERRYGLSEGGVDALVFDNPLWREVQLGRLTSGEFWDQVGHALGLGTGQLAEFRQAFWAGDDLDHELVGLIGHLRTIGYRIGLLSNAPADFRDGVDRMMPDVFDTVVISGCEGLMKPDPDIFELALARLGLMAEETVFVDDFRVNVAAACDVGMKALRFVGLPPLRRDLQQLGVDVPDPEIDPLPDVRAVIFDWGGVLERSPDEGTFAWWEQWLNVAPGVLPGVLWGPECRLLEVGGMTMDEFGKHVADCLGLADVQAGLRFIEEFYTSDCLNEGVVAIVRALRQRYKVVLLTNAFPGQDAWIREQYGLELRAEFDLYVNSAEVGLRKPDPAIYRLVLDQLGIAPEQAVLVDDQLRNVDVARSVGMHTLQFVDPAFSLPQLAALLGHSIGVSG